MATEDYRDIIEKGVLASFGTGPLVFVIPVDMAAMAAIWATMMTAIARRAGHEVSPALYKKIALAVIVSGGVYRTAGKLGQKAALWVLSYTGGFTAVSVVVNALFNGVSTLRVGVRYAELVERDDFALTDVSYIVKILRETLTPIPSAEEIKIVKSMYRSMRS